MFDEVMEATEAAGFNSNVILRRLKVMSMEKQFFMLLMTLWMSKILV